MRRNSTQVYEELQTDDKDETAELAVRCGFVIIFREVLIIILSKLPFRFCWGKYELVLTSQFARF